MEKKQSRSAKSAPKTKASLRKLTVRDLEPQKGAAIKGGTASYTIGQRTR